MALSDLAKQIILQELSNPTGAKNDKVEYKVETGLLDPNRGGGKVARISFKFSKPISSSYIESVSPKIFELISNSYDVDSEIDNIAAIFARILGIEQAKKIGQQRQVSGNIRVSLGDPQEDDENGYKGTIQAPTGKFVSNSNMMSMLELLAKQYLTSEMKRAGAPLKWRTGRFANSMQIKSLLITSKDGKNMEAIISYNYMTRPYSVFNPAVSTYRKLSLRPFRGARNPQKLIGEALAKAARDLIHSRYKIDIREGT